MVLIVEYMVWKFEKHGKMKFHENNHCHEKATNYFTQVDYSMENGAGGILFYNIISPLTKKSQK